MYTWKVVVGEMAGYWGIVGTASSHIYCPPLDLTMYQVHRKGDTRKPIPKLVTIMDYAFLQFKNVVKLLI